MGQDVSKAIDSANSDEILSWMEQTADTLAPQLVKLNPADSPELKACPARGAFEAMLAGAGIKPGMSAEEAAAAMRERFAAERKRLAEEKKRMAVWQELATRHRREEDEIRARHNLEKVALYKRHDQERIAIGEEPIWAFLISTLMQEEAVRAGKLAPAAEIAAEASGAQS
jgi:hypothetical protein